MSTERRLARCSWCGLPETYPGISFDRAGTCNYCARYEKINYLGEEAFGRTLDLCRQKGGEYDCLVPVSGGRDSAFILHYLKKVHNLRVLAYNYDSGFLAAEAKENLQRMTRALQVDLIVLRSKHDIQRRSLRERIRLCVRTSPKHVLCYLCGECEICCFGGARKIALEKNIPLIVMGDSNIEGLPYRRFLNAECVFTIKDKIAHAMKMPLNALKRRYLEYLLRHEFRLKRYDILAIKREKGPVKTEYFFDYIEWDEEKIMTTVQNHLNWRAPHIPGFSWRFDCQIHALAVYLTRAIYGFTPREELHSKMIREGKLDREEALRRLDDEENGRAYELQVLQEVFRKLGLSPQEKEAILSCKKLEG